jgi:hypothetical protein
LNEAASQSWLTAGGKINFDENGYTSVRNVIPGSGVIGEGWATFGEFIGIIYDYYIVFNDDGTIDPTRVADTAIIAGLNSVSRLASRQIIDTGLHDPKFAYTFNRAVTEQYDISKISRSDPFFRSMLQRFLLGHAQQTAYAGGLIGNLGVNAYLKKAVEEKYGPGSYDFGRFVEFRVNESDFVMGATLAEIAIDKMELFVKPEFRV